MTNQDNHQRGAVALLTAIIVSLLISIIITGTVTVMISELHQSNDSEQSIRAYNAAEAGVEDAILKIKAQLIAGTTTDQTCASPTSKNLGIDPTAPGIVGWSCQQIAFTGSPSGSLAGPDATKQFDLAGAPAMTTATLEWDTASGHNYTSPGPAIPGAAAWANRPAAMEMTLVSYPRPGPVNAAALVTKNYLILPSNGGPVTVPLGASPGGNPFYGNCVLAATYHCKVTFSGFSPAFDYVVRIRSRYVGTDFIMKFYNGVAQVQVPDGTATIDVTGKAGDVYRRVVYKVPYTNGVLSGLDYVIFSDTNICKDLTIINGAAQAGGNCGGALPPLAAAGGLGIPGAGACGIVACPPVGAPLDPSQPWYSWGTTITNLSTPNGLTISGCDWTITDTTGASLAIPPNTHCNPGDSFSTVYTTPSLASLPPYPLACDSPWTGTVNWTVKLTENFSDGSSPSFSFLTREPVCARL